MNVILYTTDFEPITVLDLPLWVLEQAEKHRAIKIVVSTPPGMPEITLPESKEPRTITIYCKRLIWEDGTVKTVYVTEDEELTLITKPAWLPGQIGTFNAAIKGIRTLTERLIKAMRK